MTPGATDTGPRPQVGLIARFVVRTDVSNWRMPSPWAIGLGIGSAVVTYPVIAVTGSWLVAGIALALSLTAALWLAVLTVRRVWCEHRPYLPPRWLAAARATIGDDLVDAALERLRDTPPRDPDRVLRRGEMIDAILVERDVRRDVRKAAFGVRIGDAVPHP